MLKNVSFVYKTVKFKFTLYSFFTLYYALLSLAKYIFNCHTSNYCKTDCIRVNCDVNGNTSGIEEGGRPSFQKFRTCRDTFYHVLRIFFVMSSYVRLYIRLYVLSYVRLYICLYVCTFIHTFTHMFIHILQKKGKKIR